MKTVIIGASSGLGRSLAKELAKKSHDLLLISQDERDLKATASDFIIRYNIKAEYLPLDINYLDPEGLIDSIEQQLGKIDNLCIIAGYHSTENPKELPPEEMNRILNVNFMAPIKIITALLTELSNKPSNIIGIGSVATCRARAKALYYGSAKCGLEFFFKALRHSLVKSPCKVQFYKLGYLDTRMTFGQKLLFKKLSPEIAAKIIADNLNKNKICYLPKSWKIITLGFKAIPWFIFKFMRTI